MERPLVRPSTIAWGTVVGGIYLYDRFCPSGEQLSERADEWCETPVKRLALAAAVGALALHLPNLINERYDLFHYLIPEKLCGDDERA